MGNCIVTRITILWRVACDSRIGPYNGCMTAATRAVCLPTWYRAFGECLLPWTRRRSPRHVDLPGWRLHPLTGDRSGRWSLRISANWRLVFRFDDGEVVDVDLVNYH